MHIVDDVERVMKVRIAVMKHLGYANGTMRPEQELALALYVQATVQQATTNVTDELVQATRELAPP